MGQVEILLAERHHTGDADQRVRDTALLQDLEDQLPDQRFSRRGRLDQDTIAWLHARAAFHQNLRKVGYAGIGQSVLLVKIV